MTKPPPNYQVKPIRRKLQSFLSLLVNRLEKRYYDDPSLEGHEIFKEWKQDGIKTINNCYKLSQLVLGRHPDKGETTQYTVDMCITHMRELIPLIDEEFDFVRTNDNKAWLMTPKFDVENNDNIMDIPTQIP